MIKTFLADDLEVIRDALRSLLEAERDIVIVGESGNGLETVELVEKLQPDVLILDLIMPGLNGLEVTRKINKRLARTRVVILSAHSDEVSIMKSLKSGAIGYVKKSSCTDDLVSAIRKANVYERFLSPSISCRMNDVLIQGVDTDKHDPYYALSERQ